MTHENTVSVSLKDLCDIADAVSTMMHDHDNGRTKYLESEIERTHLVVERWAVDETALAKRVTPTTGVACAGVLPLSRGHGQTGLDRPMPSWRRQMTDNDQNRRMSPSPPHLRRTRK